MNCWKSFNLTKDHGSLRLFLLSLFSMITFYIFFNLMVSTLSYSPHTIYFNPIILLIGLLFVVPGHKLTHCIPLWIMGQNAICIRLERALLIPMIHCEIRQPISKKVCLLIMVFPAVIGTLLTLFLTWEFPAGRDYFGALGAINFGLCLTDFIYIFYILKAPRHAYVEEDRNGCKILIKQTFF